MGVAIADGVVEQIGDVHGGVEAVERAAQGWEDLGQVPLGEGGELGVGFDDGLEGGEGEEFDSPAEAGVLAFGSFGQGAKGAVVAGEDGDGLAGLRPVPVADAKALILDGGHAGGA